MFSISTVWNSSLHSDAKSLLDSINTLGIQSIELGFSLPGKLVDELIALKKIGKVSVESVHNFCPVEPGYDLNKFMPDFFSLASPDQEQRQMALRLTKRTMKIAKSIGAKAVIVHAGRVEMEEKTKDLIALYNQGLKGKAAYNALIEEIRSERDIKKQPYMRAVLYSLDELLKLAAGLDIKICLENRYYYREIPSFEEFAVIFSHFKDSENLYYWHDVGHAQVLENLGLAIHSDYLQEYAAHLAGIHLHDVEGACDHKVPGYGKFDFSILKPYLKKHTIMVIEVHQPATEKDLKFGISYLEKALFHNQLKF